MAWLGGRASTSKRVSGAHREGQHHGSVMGNAPGGSLPDLPATRPPGTLTVGTASQKSSGSKLAFPKPYNLMPVHLRPFEQRSHVEGYVNSFSSGNF